MLLGRQKNTADTRGRKLQMLSRVDRGKLFQVTVHGFNLSTQTEIVQDRVVSPSVVVRVSCDTQGCSPTMW